MWQEITVLFAVAVCAGFVIYRLTKNVLRLKHDETGCCCECGKCNEKSSKDSCEQRVYDDGMRRQKPQL